MYSEILTDEQVLERSGLKQERLVALGKMLVVKALKAESQQTAAVEFLKDPEPSNMSPDRPNQIAQSLGDEIINLVRQEKEKAKASFA